MRITEIKITLADERSSNGRLRAFASITLDDAVAIRDIRVIEGPRGMFVAFPDRRIGEKCPDCRRRNDPHSRYCGACGRPLVPGEGKRMDLAHPITTEARRAIEGGILAAYHQTRRAGLREAVVA